MLTLDSTISDSIVTIGAAIKIPYRKLVPPMSVTWPCGLNTNDLRAGAYFDPLLKGDWWAPEDLGCILLPVIDVDLRSLYEGEEHGRQKFGGYKPHTLAEFDYQADAKRYGTGVGNLFLRAHGEKLSHGFGKSRDTTHLSYRGHAKRNGVPLNELRFPHKTDWLGHEVEMNATNRGNHDLIIGYNVSNGVLEPVRKTLCHWTQFRNDLTFDRWRSQREFVYLDESFYGIYRWTYSGFDYTIVNDGDGVTLTMNYELECFTSLQNGRACLPIGTLSDRSVFAVKREFRITAEIFPGVRDNGYFNLPVSLDLSVNQSYSLLYRDDRLGFDDPEVFHFGGAGDSNYYLAEPYVYAHVDPYKVNKGVALLHSDSAGQGAHPNILLDSFGRHVDRHHSDYVELAAFSANDAISDYTTSFNPYETVQGLRDFPALLEKPKHWAHLFKRGGMVGGKNSLDFIDALADGILSYKYAIAPASSEVAGARDSAATIYNALNGELPKLPSVLYGKYHIEKLPNRFKFPGGELADVQLTVRTKITLANDQPTLLLWLLAAHKSGFLPTTSRIFALVRYSFVVDWFTNLSQRFQFWDDTGIRALIRVAFYEHSYLYRVAVPQKTLSEYGLKSDNFECRYFMRYRSLLHPVWSGRSKYDPLDRVAIDLAAGGSLLWLRK